MKFEPDIPYVFNGKTLFFVATTGQGAIFKDRFTTLKNRHVHIQKSDFPKIKPLRKEDPK